MDNRRCVRKMRVPAVNKHTVVFVLALVLAVTLAAPCTAQAAFDLQATQDKLLSFVAFCIIVVVGAKAGGHLWGSNVTGALVGLFAGILVYGIISNPTIFKDMAEGILKFFGIG